MQRVELLVLKFLVVRKKLSPRHGGEMVRKKKQSPRISLTQFFFETPHANIHTIISQEPKYSCPVTSADGWTSCLIVFFFYSCTQVIFRLTPSCCLFPSHEVCNQCSRLFDKFLAMTRCYSQRPAYRTPPSSSRQGSSSKEQGSFLQLALLQGVFFDWSYLKS